MSDDSKLTLANISPENEDLLQELSMTLDMYEDEFKLLLARCNYQDLRDRLILHLKEIHPQPIHEIKLPRSQKDLYTYIIAQVRSETPKILSIMGLDELEDLHAALLDINLNREMFRNHCPYPIVWWISDSTHKRIIRTSPDFESWTTTLEFPIDTNELLTSLHDGSEALFSHVLAPSEIPFFKKLGQIHQLGSIQCAELETALKEISDRGLNLEPRLQANLNFIRGLDTLPPNNSPEKALQYLHASLEYWQKIGDLERSGLLLNQIGQLNYQIIKSEENLTSDWEIARSTSQACVEAFEKANRPDLVAKVILRLVAIMKQISDLETVEALVKKSLTLHLEFQNAYHIASDYSHLANISLHKQKWEHARNYGKLAISFLIQDPEANQEWRNLYLLTIAQAEINLGNTHESLKLLLEAKELGDSRHLDNYIEVLKTLRFFYIKQKQYLEAFITKQEQFAVEQQYGCRAFIGAGRLQGRLSEGKSRVDVATEIEASGRKRDLDELIIRIAKPSYKLIVLYGKSGVGKSSLVNAGLIPRLEHTSFEGKNALVIALRVYTNWEEELKKAISSEINGESIIEKLRKKESQNLRIVLIFDQFEEFFFVYYNQPTERRRFFEFVGSLLNDSQNLSSLKVVLSLREDYIHYLLECNQIESMAAIDQDILSKNVLYRVGNLKADAAKSLIQTLTQKSRLYLEPELIGAIADDLKDELGEVRPIELQVVGAQLQHDSIKTLGQYRQLGANPKAILVERYLNDVIVDCGAENERLAKFLLFMMTDEKGTRPLRTRMELERDLEDLLTEVNGDTLAVDLVLKIFVRSGLVVLIPESPLDRYQLVHDYLAEFIRASQAPEMVKLQQELVETKETLRKTVDQLSSSLKKEEIAKLNAGKRSRLAVTWGIVASVMAIGAGVAGSFALRSSDESLRSRDESLRSKVNQEYVAYSYKVQSLIDSGLQIENLIEAVKKGEEIEKNTNIAPYLKIRLIALLQDAVFRIKEKNLLVSHSKSINSIVYSPDGKYFASASSDGSVIIWNMTGKRVQTLVNLKNGIEVSGVTFSPNGKYLASASNDGTVKVWSIYSNDWGMEIKELRTLKANDNKLWGLSFSPDSKLVASASDDKTVKIWRIDDGELLHTLKGHADTVNSVVFSPNNKLIASASSDKTVKVWSVDGKELHTLKGHTNIVLSVAFSPDSKQLASAGHDNTIKIWSINGIELKSLKGHSNVINGIAFSPDGKNLASASWDATVKLWSVDGQLLQTFIGHSGAVSSLCFSPNGQNIVSASWDKTIRIWNIQGQEPQTLQGHRDKVKSVAYSPDGKKVATASWDKTVKIWSVDGKELLTLKGHRDNVTYVIFSSDGKKVATASWDKTVKIWSVDNGKLLHTLNGHTDKVRSVSFSPDGKQLASASEDQTVRIWSVDDGKELDIKFHGGIVWSVIFSPNGSDLASASSDKTVKIWRVGSRLTLNGHTDIVRSLAFSPDGSQLASASYDKTIRIWNISDKDFSNRSDNNSIDSLNLKEKNDFILSGHTSAVNGIAFSHDGNYLASASDDQTVKIWSVKEKKELHTLKGHSNKVITVAFSPNDKYLASASDDRSAKIWNIDYGSLKGLACYWLQDYISIEPKQQKELPTCLDPKTLKAAAPALVAEARTKGMDGKPEDALSLFQEAKKLDSSISLDPQIEISPYFITKGERLAREGDIKAALAAYDEALKRNPNIKIPAASWNTLCWNGSLYNSASQVIFACDNAVKLEPDNLDIRQNRSIAKALIGDSNGAISEFEISLPKIYRENLEVMLSLRERNYAAKYSYVDQQGWLEDLKEGKNPFTDEKLEEWRQKAKSDQDS